MTETKGNVYLAGPMREVSKVEMQGWRGNAGVLLGAAGYGVCDPVKRFGLECRQIVEGDLAEIDTCCAMLVQLPRPGVQAIGTCMEIFYARHVLRIPVLGFGDNDSPWIRYHVVVFPEMTHAIEAMPIWVDRNHSPFDSLRFDVFRRLNAARCAGSFGGCDRWSPAEWGCALAGEVGEACNLLKKMRRGDGVELADVGRELADVVTYADLLAHVLGLDLGRCVRTKFNEVSERRGSTLKL